MKLTLACLLVLALIFGAACTQTVEAPPETDLPTAAQENETPLTGTPTPEATGEPNGEETTPPDAINGEDIEAARQVVLAYFEALNNYDLEAALACMEESWGQGKETSLTGEISQMKSWGVTLIVEEEAEPAINADETIEIKVKITPSKLAGPRHAVYQLMEIEEEWKICYSEDVE